MSSMSDDIVRMFVTYFFSVMTLCVMNWPGCASGMNKEFCKSNKPNRTAGTAKTLPSLPRDFAYFDEKTLYGSKLTYEFMVYSMTNEVRFTDSQTDRGKLMEFTDAGNDQYYFYMLFRDDQKMSCDSDPLIGSYMEMKYHLKRFPNATLSLVRLQYPGLYLDESSEPEYIGETTVRGIPADEWYVCLYGNYTKETILTKIYFSSEKVNITGSENPVLLMEDSTSLHDESTGNTTQLRQDFTQFTDTISKEVKHRMERPAFVNCPGSPISHRIPPPPVAFHYQVEEIVVGGVSTTKSPSEPTLDYYEKTFASDLKVFSMLSDLSISTSSVYRHHQHHLILQDFQSALDYDLDLVYGNCIIRDINLAHDYAGSEPDVTKMESPVEFFHLSPNTYHYTGEHTSTDRGIDVDTYVTEEAGVMQAWSFASKDWMLKKMGFKEYKMIPVEYRTWSQDQPHNKITHIFNFQTSLSDKDIYPDVSRCFPQEKTIKVTIALYLKENDLKKFTIPERDFRSAMINVTSLTSSVRVAEIKFKKHDFQTVHVSFDLFGLSNLIGASQHLIKRPKTAEIYRQMYSAVKAKKFVVNFQSSQGIHHVTAVAIEQRETNSFPQINDSESTSTNAVVYTVTAVVAFITGAVLGFVSFKLMKKTKRRRATSIKFENLIEVSLP